MPRLKHFDTLYDLTMHLIEEGHDTYQYINGVRLNLYKDPRTAYPGKILDSMKLIMIHDVTPIEVDYEDTSETAYRDPNFVRVYVPGGRWSPHPAVISAWCSPPTMAVDAAGNLYVGEKFVADLFHKYGTQVATEMVKAILIHESMHISEMSFFRGQGRMHQVWNIASDAYINLHISRNGFPLPEDGIVPDKDGFIKITLKGDTGPTVFKLQVLEKTTEQLYDEIVKLFKDNRPKGPRPPPPPPQPRPLQRGDPVYNKKTKDYGVVLSVTPIKIRVIDKGEAKIRAQKKQMGIVDL